MRGEKFQLSISVKGKRRCALYFMPKKATNIADTSSPQTLKQETAVKGRTSWATTHPDIPSSSLCKRELRGDSVTSPRTAMHGKSLFLWVPVQKGKKIASPLQDRVKNLHWGSKSIAYNTWDDYIKIRLALASLPDVCSTSRATDQVHAIYEEMTNRNREVPNGNQKVRITSILSGSWFLTVTEDRSSHVCHMSVNKQLRFNFF